MQIKAEVKAVINTHGTVTVPIPATQAGLEKLLLDELLCCSRKAGILLMLVIFILGAISLPICILVAPDLAGTRSFIHMQHIWRGIIFFL